MKILRLAATALACVVATTLMVGATVSPQEAYTNPTTPAEAGAAAQSTAMEACAEGNTASAIIEQAVADQAAEKRAAEMEAARKAAQAANTSFKENQATDSSKSASKTSSSSGKSTSTSSAETSTNKRTITIDGVTMSYSDSYGASSAPDSGAGIWRGSDSTTDGSYSYYIGHNPGSFAVAADASTGSQITVNDSDGNSRTYTVVDTFVVSRGSTWGDISDRVTSHGESVALQTCVDGGYKILVAE